MKKLLSLSLVCCLVMVMTTPAPAWAWDDAAGDWDAQILQAIEDSETWGMVLTELDAWTADEMWGLVESVDIPPVSQSTRAAIRDKLAIDNRIPDNRFTHMPHAEEGWIIHLIVDVVIIIVLAVVGYVVSPYVSAWLAGKQATTAAVGVPVESAVVGVPVESAVVESTAATSAKAALEMANALKISSFMISVVETEVVSAQTNLELGEGARAWVHALCAWEHVLQSVLFAKPSRACTVRMGTRAESGGDGGCIHCVGDTECDI